MCHYAYEVWREIKRCFVIRCKIQYLASIKQWLFDFLDGATDEEAMVFTITAWHIWEPRNAVCNGENHVHPNVVAERMKAYVQVSI